MSVIKSEPIFCSFDLIGLRTFQRINARPVFNWREFFQAICFQDQWVFSKREGIKNESLKFNGIRIIWIDPISSIIKEGDRVAAIVRSLLSFAKDRQEGKGPVQVVDVLSESVALVNATFRKDGIELIVALRKSQPSAKIIAISGGGRLNAKDYLGIAQKLGAAATLAKPFSGSDLVATVERVLAG